MEWKTRCKLQISKILSLNLSPIRVQLLVHENDFSTTLSRFGINLKLFYISTSTLNNEIMLAEEGKR